MPVPEIVYGAEALEKVSEERVAFVLRVTVPEPFVAKVAVSFTLSAPSRPGVPPAASQTAKLVQFPPALETQ